jgi:transcriptional regulatory protein LevR
MDELKERGLQDEEIDLLTSTHIQTIFDDYQRYLTKQVMNLGQLSKVVDRKIIEEVKQFLDTAQDKFNVMYPMSLYYGLSLHVGSLLENNGRSQKLGNQQIMQVVSQYNNEYVYCLQFIHHLEQSMKTRIPVDEAVILTMFLVNQDTTKSNAKPVLLFAMHGHQTASSLATVVNTLVQADNTYGFDMSLDSEPMESYGHLKEMIQRIHQGKGIIVIYDMGSFKDMLLNIAKETGIEIRQLYMPITLLGIDAARRSMLDEDIDNTYHHLLQNIQQIYAQEEYKFKAPIFVTLCATGEGGALELKKYIERYSTKPREVIPLAISDRKVLVEKVKELLEVYSIKSFIGTYNPNLFGIPYISIQDVFECPPEKIDQLLEFNPIGDKGLDMEAIYDYLDDSLEYVDIQKIRKYLPNLLDSIENVSNETLDMDQKLGLFIHIASSINRSLSKETSPVNRKREQIFAKYEPLTKELVRLLKPIERSFGIIVNDDEIANIVCIIKKL